MNTAAIKNRLQNMDNGIVLIIIYSLFQGIQTFYNIGRQFMYIYLPKAEAAINILFLILGAMVLVGAVGLFIQKEWGRKITIGTYGAIIPLIGLTAFKGQGAGYPFYLSCAVDIIVAGGILTYLSFNKIKALFISGKNA